MRIEAGMTALVTGASRGMGVHIARALAERKVSLVLAARSQAGLESVAAPLQQQTGIMVLCVAAYMADESALAALLAAAEREFGGIDILVNNAGLESAGRYELAEPAELRQMIEVNLLASMLLTRLALPGMIARSRGHIVNIVSVAGLLPSAYEESYNASKYVYQSLASKVGAAVIPAVEKNLPDLLLMPGAPRLNVVFGVLWPRFFEKLNAWLDLSRTFRTIANAKL